MRTGPRLRSVVELWERLPEEERAIMDVLRQIILATLPDTCTERLAYNVPFYYGKRRICLIWPASVPRGGFEQGVLLGFCQGHRLADPRGYLHHGTNKVVYYRIFRSIAEIDQEAIVELLHTAVELDRT
jgi:hypothetical protein